jgi:RNA polymerase sigma-70 factor, ECF subfamily
MTTETKIKVGKLMTTYPVTRQNTASSYIPAVQAAKAAPAVTAAPASPARQSSAATLDRVAALQAVYDAHVEQIYKFVFFKVGNREDAEDITSQVFIKAAQSLDVTQEVHTRLAWLYQVARTTITDHWRGYYRGVTSSLDELEEVSPLHLAAEPLVMGGSEVEEVEPAVARVREVLALLPENYRRVLEFRFLQGCSLKETAAAMNITEANAKVIQHRAIQKALKVGAQFI